MPTIKQSVTRNHREYVDTRYMPRHIKDANGNKYELVIDVDVNGKPSYKYKKMSWLSQIFGN